MGKVPPQIGSYPLFNPAELPSPRGSIFPFQEKKAFKAGGSRGITDRYWSQLWLNYSLCYLYSRRAGGKVTGREEIVDFRFLIADWE
jgi:hypothetical protein